MPRHRSARSGPSRFDIALMSRPHSSPYQIIFPFNQGIRRYTFDEFNDYMVAHVIHPEEIRSVIARVNTEPESIKNISSNSSNGILCFILGIVSCCFLFCFGMICIVIAIYYLSKARVDLNEVRVILDNCNQSRFHSLGMNWRIGELGAWISLDIPPQNGQHNGVQTQGMGYTPIQIQMAQGQNFYEPSRFL